MATNLRPQKSTMNPGMMDEVQPSDAAACPLDPATGERLPTDEMLTPTELAVRLKTTVRTIGKWKRRRVLLGIKLDKMVLFYWPNVVARLVEKYQDREKGAAPEQSLKR